MSSLHASLSPSSRSTEFTPVSDAISPEVRAFGGLFMVLWLLLLTFIFVTRRSQRLLGAEVERLELTLEAASGEEG